MKKILVFAAAAALLSVSCNRETYVPSVGTVTRTFTVNAPGEGEDATPGRTYLDGATAVLWSASDKINVIAATSGNQYTFSLTSGEGTASATFEGALLEDDAEETVFYAVYPDVAIRPAQLSASTPLIEFDATMGTVRKAVAGGYDPAKAVLTAVSDGDSFSFRHGSAYFKIKIGQEGVYKVKIESSNGRFSGRPQYNLDGSYSNIQNASNTVELVPEEGTLSADASYYIPILCKNAALQTLTVTYFYDAEFTDGVSLSTGKMTSLKPALGVVYDLGTPPISNAPILATDNVSIGAEDTGGTIEYTLERAVDGGELSIALDAEYESTIAGLSFGAPAGGSVSFSCDANDGEDDRTAKFILTYTYGGGKTVTAEAYISQDGTGGAGDPVHSYTLYANGTKTANILQTADGEAGDYFTLPSAITGVALNSYTGYPFTQPAADNTVKDFAYGIKMNGNAEGLAFTTSATLTSTLTIYIVAKGTSTCNFKLTPAGGDTVQYPCEQGTVSKYEISLAKSTEYTVTRGGEHALIYAVVNEY